MEIQVEKSLHEELALSLAQVDKLTLELEGLSRKVTLSAEKVALSEKKVKLAEKKVGSVRQ
jgi:uncharacterized protein YabE (DUF348 family)